MIARLVPYRTPPGTVQLLVDEVVAAARVRATWPVRRTNRRAEFFFVDTSTGGGLSLVIGDDRTVTPVIELTRPVGDAEEYDVHLLQIGGPRQSGVVDARLGRIVRCDPDGVVDLSFNGDAVPRSPDVWARGLLVAVRGDVLAFAVATDRGALEQSLQKFASRCVRVDDYDDVAYHFLGEDAAL
jgi:hypothetical protein